MPTFTKDNINKVEGLNWKFYRKKTLTKIARMGEPFTIITREGTLSIDKGRIAIDPAGYPYPIDEEEFKAIYEEVEEL